MEAKINMQMDQINRMQKDFIRMYAPVVELWLPVYGYGSYEVSSFGRVKNIKTKKIMKLNKVAGAYFQVGLRRNGKRKNFLIHRLVAAAFIDNPDDKDIVDHKNHDTTNNKVSNLRFATKSENGMNSSKHSNNTSGVIGVYWNKQKKKWCARIQIDGISKHLGQFNSIQSAKRARVKAVNKLFGEFAYKE